MVSGSPALSGSSSAPRSSLQSTRSAGSQRRTKPTSSSARRLQAHPRSTSGRPVASWTSVTAMPSSSCRRPVGRTVNGKRTDSKRRSLGAELKAPPGRPPLLPKAGPTAIVTGLSNGFAGLPSPANLSVTGKLHLCDTPQLRPQLWIFRHAPTRRPSLSRPRRLRRQERGVNRLRPARILRSRIGPPPQHRSGPSSRGPRRRG